ncbi:hypothetical protein [Pseudonocardia hierapolitana]|uniref:hypothetical protein n=1 Tax=Pseudonocardia hierapolitana TaxID=1128676 RepID=UPI0011BFE4BE|nr:hypothetical protein [Pseudonocardia hierapolitana]
MADSHGMCAAYTRPGTGYRHTPRPCPDGALALPARDNIRARVTARRLMAVNGAATGTDGDKR